MWKSDNTRLIELMELLMADYTILNASVAALNAKVDAFLAKPAPVPPVDEQPTVDAIAKQVDDITAKIPA